MKLLCIKEEDKRFGYKIISLNEVYDGEIYHGEFGDLENYWCVSPNTNNSKELIDRGGTWVFSKDALIPLSEWRDKQIENILNGEEETQKYC